MTLLEKLQSMTPAQRAERLATIRPMIEDLSNFYNSHFQTVDLVLTWADRETLTTDPHYSRISNVSLKELGRIPEVVEFIHTLCTNLCAEKLILEALGQSTGAVHS